MITIKIDYNKIDTGLLYQGRTARYLDCVVFERKGGKDDYGNTHVVVQSVSKADRAKGIKGEIIGSMKLETESRPASTQQPRTQSKPVAAPVDAGDDVPF